MMDFVLALYIQKILCSEISKLKLQLSKNHQLKIVQNIENKFLGLFKTVKFQASAIKEIKEGIIANIVQKK